MPKQGENARRHNSGVVNLTIVITAFMVVGTLTPFALAALGPFLVTHFSLSRVQFGALTTAHFVVAALLSPLLGRWTDQITTRTATSVLFVAAAGSLAGLALSPTYGVLITFAGAAGAAQALANPLSNKLVADNIPPLRQGIVVGVKQSGVPVGMALAGASLPLLAVMTGWRTALGGAATLVVVGWGLSVVHLPVRVRAALESGDSTRVLDRKAVALGVRAFLMGSAAATVTPYLPLYANDALGFPPAIAGTLVGAVGVVGVGSRILVGYVADRLGDITLALKVLPVVATAAVAALLLAPIVDVGLVWLGAILFGWSLAWNTAAMLAVVKLASRRTAGQMSGHVMAGFFGGFLVAPIAFGGLVDATESYALAWTMLMLLLATTSVLVWAWPHTVGRH